MRDHVVWPEHAAASAGVGQMLREARESLGLRVADVARDLRIRRPYIEALEDERFGDLPGAAYAPAFLRAYAAHLGLDPERVVAGYRSGGESAPGASRALAFPVAPAERRTPKGALVLASVALLVGAYLTWQHFNRGVGPSVERVARPPERLLTGAPPEAAKAAPPSAPAVSTHAAAAAQVVPPSAAVAVPAAAKPAYPPAATPAPPTVAAPAATPSVAATPAPAAVEILRPGVTPASGAAPASVIQSPPQQASAPPLPAPVTVATPAGAAHAASLPPPPRHVGEDQPVRPDPASAVQTAPPSPQDRTIVPRVASVLELRDAGGDVLAVTHVPAGQPYTVPAGIGYRLLPAVRP